MHADGAVAEEWDPEAQDLLQIEQVNNTQRCSC